MLKSSKTLPIVSLEMYYVMKKRIKAKIYTSKYNLQFTWNQYFTKYWCWKLLCLENTFEFIWNLKPVLKFENLIWIWEKFILSVIFFQTWTTQSRSMCLYSTLSCDKLEYTHMAPLLRIHVWNKFSYWIILFQIEIKFSNFRTRFEISN